MDEKPAEAVRAKPNSSLVVANRLVADGRADAVLSAGNTGAMLAAGLLEIRRLPGVMRPAIAVVLPSRRGPSVLLDSGANADARPEHLLQFAYMGAIFAEEVLELPQPVRPAALDRRGAGEGEPARARGARAARRERPQLRGQHRVARAARGRGGRRRHRRLHRQRLPQAARGDDPHAARRAARGDRRRARAGRSAGCSSGPRRGRCGTASTRTPTAARTCSVSAASR